MSNSFEGGGNGDGSDKRKKVVDIKSRKTVGQDDALSRQRRHGQQLRQRNESPAQMTAREQDELRAHDADAAAAAAILCWRQTQPPDEDQELLDDLKQRYGRYGRRDLEEMLAVATDDMISTEPIYYVALAELYEEKKRSEQTEQEPR